MAPCVNVSRRRDQRRGFRSTDLAEVGVVETGVTRRREHTVGSGEHSLARCALHGRDASWSAQRLKLL